jgi:hypothetical protein
MDKDVIEAPVIKLWQELCLSYEMLNYITVRGSSQKQLRYSLAYAIPRYQET